MNMLFLIEYDRPSGTIVQLREFGGSNTKAAQDAQLQLELRLNRERVEHEVVLLDAPSKEALLRTHSRYFKSLAELASSAPVAGKGGH
jgi:hypothetical protein